MTISDKEMPPDPEAFLTHLQVAAAEIAAKRAHELDRDHGDAPVGLDAPVTQGVSATKRLEASAELVESLELGFHLGAALERIAIAATEGSRGGIRLKEAIWLIDRHLALLEARPRAATPAAHAPATPVEPPAPVVAPVEPPPSPAPAPAPSAIQEVVEPEPLPPAAAVDEMPTLTLETPQPPEETPAEPEPPVEPPEPDPPVRAAAVVRDPGPAGTSTRLPSIVPSASSEHAATAEGRVARPPRSIMLELLVTAVKAGITIGAITLLVLALTLIAQWR